MEEWRDRVALITGATSGIGESIARRLRDEGMRVVLCGRRIERLQELAAEAPEQSLAIQCDLRNEDQILQMFEEIKKVWGGVDVLVNNAGLGHDAPLTTGNTEHWRDMLEVNILALCICSREATKQMHERGDKGYIIHISSMSGHRVPPGSGVYSATKYAVRSLTEGLRAELRAKESGIRISAISPGFVETEFAAQYHRSEETAREIYSRFPVLQPEDIAEAVQYLLGTPQHVQVHDILMRPTEQVS